MSKTWKMVAYGKCTAADTRKSGTREGDVVDLEW